MARLQRESECFICGCKYRPRNSRHLTCSKECSVERERRYSQQWRAAHPEHAPTYYAANRQRINRRTRAYHEQHRREQNAKSLARYHAKKASSNATP